MEQAPGLAALLDTLARVLNGLLQTAGLTAADCAGIAIGFPGVVDFRTIEQVEPDGKLRAKALIDTPSQKLYWVAEHEIDGRNLEAFATKAKEQAVLLRDAIEAPRVIRLFPGQVAYFLHPMARTIIF